MIGYVTIGTNDFEKSVSFFEELFAVLNEKKLWQFDGMAAFGSSREHPALCVTKPFDKQKASVGNGVMVALKVETKQQVIAVHKKALSLGAKNEGEPGPRGTGGFYGGYFRDLDGNKFNVYLAAKSAE